MKNKLFVALFGLFLLAFSFSTALAQTDDSKFDFYARAPYRGEVPRPQSILRYDAGTFHTTYAQMESVIDKIAKAVPDRIRIYDIGETNEHRMQHVVAISSPENIARLDEIKGNIARLSDPRKTSPSEAQSIIANSPIMCWMAYTIHGNESASFEAMMQVIYQLSASNEPATLDILKNSVALIVVGENPDGHERFVTWYNSVSTGDPNRAALEHREPWSIWGRYNHYRFDLNRDNIVATQAETRNLQRAYFEWNPQISVDHHGQPSQFFFPPAALPINPNLPQPVTNKWLDVFGRANASQFDQRNWDYYVRDIFDLFYPGYWDSMPSLNGATGMTYETDGGGFKGINWTRDDGTIVTLRSAIAKHYIASMTTLETAAKNREARLKDFYEFRRAAMAEAKAAKMKRVIILPGKDPAKTADMIESLQRARVEISVAKTSFNSTTAHNYSRKDAPAASQTFPAGSYIIDFDQPQRTWAKSLLEQDTPQDPAFVREQIAKFRRNELRGKSAYREDYGFYDITTWSLPLAFGVDAYWTEDAGSAGGDAVTDAYLQSQRTGGVTGGRAQIAYIIPYETDGAGALAIRLLQNGFRVAVSTRPLNAGSRDWKTGAFVVRISRNPEAVHQAIAQFARELGVTVTAVNTGFNETGDTGVGAENVATLRAPKIAVLADEGVNQTSFGSLWWTLDRYGIKFTPLSMNSVKSGALKDFNVLILPDGSAGGYFSGLGAGGVSTIKEWTSSGGNLVCMRGSAVFAALKDVGLTSTKLVGSDDDDQRNAATDDKPDDMKPTPTPDDKNAKGKMPMPTPTPSEVDRPDKSIDGIAPVLPPIASPSATAGKVPEGIPGAIFRATVDRTAQINYGVGEDTMPVLLASGYFFRYSKEGINAMVFDAKPKTPLVISGFAWEGNTERLLRGTSYLIDEPTGGGHVILFAEDPFFRGIFRTMTRPFFNSILLN